MVIGWLHERICADWPEENVLICAREWMPASVGRYICGEVPSAWMVSTKLATCRTQQQR